MKHLSLFLIFFLHVVVATAQLHTNAGYDCDEELFPRFDRTTRSWGYVNMVGVWRVEPTFTKAERYAGKLAVVQKGTKFGLLNCEGRLVAMPVYDEIQNFVNGKGWARQGSLWGMLDDKGRLVVPPAFEDVRPVGDRNELTWVKKKGIWGVFSKDRVKMVVEPKYEACRSISDSLGIGLRAGYMDPIYLGTGQVIYDSCTRFEKATGNSYTFVYKKQWGLMEVTGSVLIRPEYDTIIPYKKYIIVKQKTLWAMASLSGRFVTGFDFEDVKGTDYTLLAAKKKGKWGYVLPDGKPYIPFEYDYVIPQTGQYYSLQRGGGEKSTAILRLNDKLKQEDFRYSSVQVLFDLPIALLAHRDSTYTLKQLESGKEYPEKIGLLCQIERLPWLYPSIGDPVKPDTNSKEGIVDARDFNRYLPLSKEDNYHMLYEPYTIVGKAKKNNLGLMHFDSKKIIIPKENNTLGLIEGTKNFYAVKNNNIKVYNEAGKVLFMFVGENIIDYYKMNTYSFKKDGKYGMIQAPDKIILKPEYTRLLPSGTFLERAGLPFIAKKKKNLFLLSWQGDKLSEEFDTIQYIGNGIYSALASGKYSLLDKSGKVASNLTPDYVHRFAEGLLLVRVDGSYTFLNKALKPAFKLAVEDAFWFENGTARVKMNGRWYLINKQGKVVQVLSL